MTGFSNLRDIRSNYYSGRTFLRLLIVGLWIFSSINWLFLEGYFWEFTLIVSLVLIVSLFILYLHLFHFSGKVRFEEIKPLRELTTEEKSVLEAELKTATFLKLNFWPLLIIFLILDGCLIALFVLITAGQKMTSGVLEYGLVIYIFLVGGQFLYLEKLYFLKRFKDDLQDKVYLTKGKISEILRSNYVVVNGLALRTNPGFEAPFNVGDEVNVEFSLRSLVLWKIYKK